MARRTPTIVFILCWLLVVAGSTSAAPQTEQDAAKTVDNVVQAAQAVWKHGKSARSEMRKLRSSHRKASSAIRVMGRQLRKLPAPEAPADEKQVEADCLTFVTAVESLVRMGIDAAKAMEVAASKAQDEKVGELLDAIARPAYDRLASEAMAPYLGHGTYLGMFDKYRDHGAKLSAAFSRILSNRDAKLDRRLLAGEGVAQLVDEAGAEAKKAVIGTLHAMIDDEEEEPQVKDKCVTVLARLGDRKIFDGLVKERLDVIRAEQAKGADGNPGRVLGALQQLISLHQESKEYRKAALFFSDFMQRVLTIPMAQLQAQGRRQISIQCYNFACVLSRIGEEDFGLWALEESFNYGYNSWDWTLKDGDLENLRKDKRFQETLAAWKEGKKKPGSMSFDAKAFQAMVKRIMPKEKTQPEAKPDSADGPGSDS